MSDEQLVDTPPAESAAPPPEPPAEPAAPPDIDQQIEQAAIDIPDGDRLVPLSVVQALREERRALKPKAEKADTLEAELASLRAKQQESAPIIEAARAIVQAAQAQAQQMQAAPAVAPQDDAELVDLARDLDLYTPEGKPDVTRAAKIQARQLGLAKRIAEETTAPLVADTLQQRAAFNLSRAKNTTLQDGTKVDPAILEDYWRRLPPALLANEQQAMHVWKQAVADTVIARGVKAQTTTLPKVDAPPPPLYTEIAGGSDRGLPKLNAGDKRLAKDMGLSEAEFAKQLAEMPDGWGKNR